MSAALPIPLYPMRGRTPVYTLLVLNIAREISRRLRQADQALVDVGLAVQSRMAEQG